MDSKSENSHHNTHALPPRFVQQAYTHYNKAKASELNEDDIVIDFKRGLSEQQKQVIKPVGIVSAQAIETACSEFSKDCLGQPLQYDSRDVVIYEHQDFPGLQITPAILPPQIQVLFVSEILHKHLANPNHKINLQTEYDIDYPKGLQQLSVSEDVTRASFFSYAPTDTHSQPKSQHPKVNMVQFLSKKLRWLTIGEQYDWPTRSYKRDGPTSFPPNIAKLVSTLFPHIRSESGVCLLYGSKDFMPVHRDVSEQCERALASFSFGCDGIFLVARGTEEIDDLEERSKRIVAIRVRSGDCVHMTGESRWAWHAMPRTFSGTCPEYMIKWPAGTGTTTQETKAYEKWKGFMGTKRLNVSCRQVWD